MTVDGTSDTKLHYTPPTSDAKGITVACGIITLFFSVWYHALFQIDFVTSKWIDILATFFVLEFLYTGIFITCHDATHGAVSPRVSDFVALYQVTLSICFSS